MLSTIIHQVRLSWRLMADPRVPTGLKVIVPALAAMYTFSPVDMIPDFLIGLGQLDDVGILLAALALFVRLAPKRVVAEHRAAMTGRAAPGSFHAESEPDVIDVDYSVGTHGRNTAGH
jgi:uncharacterized membrane protein YkvA (DUF1232 family)